jgi:hypothetical protein
MLGVQHWWAIQQAASAELQMQVEETALAKWLHQGRERASYSRPSRLDKARDLQVVVDPTPGKRSPQPSLLPHCLRLH